MHRPLPNIVRGEGVYLFDAEGRRYLDACGGAMVASIGHGVREVGEAIGRQAAALAYVNGTAFTNPPVEELARDLIARAPAGFGKAYFLSSGSEAVEAALKLARQYHVERGDLDRRTVIALSPGYHGNTLLALSASAREHYKRIYGPWLVDVKLIKAPYAYRADDAQRAPEMTGAALQAAIDEIGARNVAAFIFEPIGGSSTGASVPPQAYARRVREICDASGVLLVADEVLTGAGRTGRFFAIDHLGVAPDIITLGKGLNGGYAPLSAVLASDRVVDAVTGNGGDFMHAQTYVHHPLSAAAALATLHYIDDHGLVEKAAQGEPGLQARLRALADAPGGEIVGDVRGKGLLAAIEFVRDRGTRAPFPRAAKVAEAVVDAALANGIVVWPNVGHANGVDGDLIVIAPPLTITDAQLDELAEGLRRAFSQLKLTEGAKT